MKLKTLMVLAASILLVGGTPLLSACKPAGGNNSNVTHTVTYTESDDYEVVGLQQSYRQGDTVSFSVNVLNVTKKLSTVRAGSTKLTANDQGIYSFRMGDADVVLTINLSNKATPEFEVSYTGTPEVGQTLTFTSTVNGAAFNDFTLAATTGGNLITINGKQVVLNTAGNVTLNATATYQGFNLSKVVSFVIATSEGSLGTNIGYESTIARVGGESQATQARGDWHYLGVDEGVASSCTYNSSNGQYTLNYTNGWAWYSIQLFYVLPYAEPGDSYDLRWEVNSDAAGQITIGGNKITLQAGDNSISTTVSQATGKATISVQFGTMTQDGQTESNLQGSVFKFKTPRLYDKNSAHTYHLVNFIAQDQLLKSIYVRNNNTVVAPEAPAKANYIFGGYFDGEEEYKGTLAITKAYNFVARYVEDVPDNQVTVTFKNANNEVVGTMQIAKGLTITMPTNLNLGFGKQPYKLFTNQALTQEFDFNTAINNDTTLYVKARIVYESSYVHDVGSFDNVDWVSYGDDGSVTITMNGWGATGWNVQANFNQSVITGEAGKTYRISFTYSINVEGATYQIYDGHQVEGTNGSLDVGNNVAKSFTYAGGTLSGGQYLTFELGATPLNQTVIFTLHSIDLVEVTA